MVWKKISFVPGLYKIFGEFLPKLTDVADEILVNAADNYQKDKTQKYIKVVIDTKTHSISVENDGRGHMETLFS